MEPYPETVNLQDPETSFAEVVNNPDYKCNISNMKYLTFTVKVGIKSLTKEKRCPIHHKGEHQSKPSPGGGWGTSAQISSYDPLGWQLQQIKDDFCLLGWPGWVEEAARRQ